ncbi:hypothetical protein SVAN01_07103 [Stagonosporopsis vannaccii]|nr:hypothetical protein SVAN01_07103 [Stagonosporopsis vannaccii]
MSSTTKSSPLLFLPAELRNIIWTLVLGETIVSIDCEIRIPWGIRVKNSTAKQHNLALLRTCRQIHNETRLLPFILNTFQFRSEDVFKPWLARFKPEQRLAIAQIRLITWKARHMVESRGFAPRKLGDVFQVEMFGGLRRVDVEVRYTRVVRECEKWACAGSELEDSDWVEQEGRLRLRWKKSDPNLEVLFERVAVTTSSYLMAPSRTSLRPTPRNKRAFVNTPWLLIVKAKSQPNCVRRLRNGLLDVAGKCKEHLTITHSAATSSTSFWSKPLRGEDIDCLRNLSCKCPCPPVVCRQIYAEAALIPFSSNAFRFSRDEAFDWVRHLLTIQQNSMREVHIVTHRAERAFPIDLFPELKKEVIKVRSSFIYNFTAGDDLTAKQQDRLIKEFID